MIISDRIGRKISELMLSEGVIKETETDIYSYCYSYLLDKLIYTAYIIIVAIVLRQPFSIIVFFSVLLPLRTICGGVHADTQLKCSILSFLVPPSIICLSVSFQPHIITSLGTFAISLVILLIFAPVGNKNNMISESKRQKLKKTLIIYSFPLVIMLALYMYLGLQNLIFMTVLCTLFCAVAVILGIIKNRRTGVCTLT